MIWDLPGISKKNFASVSTSLLLLLTSLALNKPKRVLVGLFPLSRKIVKTMEKFWNLSWKHFFHIWCIM